MQFFCVLFLFIIGLKRKQEIQLSLFGLEGSLVGGFCLFSYTWHAKRSIEKTMKLIIM